MGCNCKGGGKSMGSRNFLRKASMTSSSSSKSLTPTDRRALEMQANNNPQSQTMTAARREIERKRRLAIQRSLGK